jgi:hypothetical protein
MKAYLWKKSYKKCHKKLRSWFPSVSVPYKSTIYQLENKVQTTGFLLWKKQVTLYALSEETLYDTGVCSQVCSKKSLGWLSHENNVSFQTDLAHCCKTASLDTLQLYSFAKSPGSRLCCMSTIVYLAL